MFLGLLTIELRLPGCDTLKEKRHRIKGVIERVRSKFNVSASEVGNQDLHQSAIVATAMVNSDKLMIEQVLARIEDIFANGDGLMLTSSSIEWF